MKAYIPTLAQYLKENDSKTYYEVSVQIGKYNPIYYEPSDPSELLFDTLKDAKKFVDSATHRTFGYEPNTEIYITIDEFEDGYGSDEVYKRHLPNVNEQSDILLDKVKSWFERKYDESPDSYGGKYYTLDIEDEEDEWGDAIGRIYLRFADHSENVRNNDRYRGASADSANLSIVIADYDPTADKFIENRIKREYELKFTSKDSFNKITKTIQKKLDMIEKDIRSSQ